MTIEDYKNEVQRLNEELDKSRDEYQNSIATLENRINKLKNQITNDSEIIIELRDEIGRDAEVICDLQKQNIGSTPEIEYQKRCILLKLDFNKHFNASDVITLKQLLNPSVEID